MERRCSAITLGLTPLPAISSRCPSATNIWDYFRQPPDIQLTQATPKMSPNLGERPDHRHYHSCDNGNTARKWKKAQRRRSIDQDSFDSACTYPERGRRFFYDDIEEEEMAETTVLAQQINKLGLENRCLDDTIIKYTMNNTNLLSNRRAPLASISSLKMSSIDCQDSELRSPPMSDSVFGGTFADTDDDMDQFSTDSDVIDDANRIGGEHYSGKEMKAIRSRKSNYCSKHTTTANVECTVAEVTTTSIRIPHADDDDGNNGADADLDRNRETICEIHEIGPMADSKFQSNDSINRNTNENVNKLLQLGSSGGSISNKCSKSTGNVTQEVLHHDKGHFLSEPLSLHKKSTKTEHESLKLHKSGSRNSINKFQLFTKMSSSSISSINSNLNMDTTTTTSKTSSKSSSCRSST